MFTDDVYMTKVIWLRVQIFVEDIFVVDNDTSINCAQFSYLVDDTCSQVDHKEMSVEMAGTL